jgi:HSP20 family protein
MSSCSCNSTEPSVTSAQGQSQSAAPASCCSSAAPANAAQANPTTARRFVPQVDLREVPNGIELVANLPGVSEDRLEILLDKHVLTIRGQVSGSAPEGATPVYCEYGVGDYERVFTLPTDIDQDRIEAHFANGVLTLSLPRQTPPAVRRIAVATTTR